MRLQNLAATKVRFFFSITKYQVLVFLYMAGEALSELALAALGDETLEDIGNKVETVTKRIPFLKYAVVSAFFIGWGVYFLWFR